MTIICHIFLQLLRRGFLELFHVFYDTFVHRDYLRDNFDSDGNFFRDIKFLILDLLEPLMIFYGFDGVPAIRIGCEDTMNQILGTW